ncbi:MAG: alpha-2,8-polysialyltransferase family protein [Nitrososphaera sp.]|nr:alpha-2,8-polysialyltransferase family protein [Nitrososphaera sp.]
MKIAAANVFLVETPLQLLNAIEAKNYFRLTNNHLVVHVGGTGFPPESLYLLIHERDWDGVHHLLFYNKKIEVASRLLGPRLSAKIQGYCYDIQQALNKRKLNSIAGSFTGAKNIFLGNYLSGCQLYMRHFANTLEHESLYLLDDGTDVLLINTDRRNKSHPKNSGSRHSRLKTKLRKNMVEWNDKDADRVTFFTAYSVDVTSNDRVIRNEYTFLREIAASSAPSNEVFFLGQSLVEDKYVMEEYYLDYLRKIKKYFTGINVLYIPHPRQSIKMIDSIRDSLGLEIKQFSFPIECEISIRGNAPDVLASFFCSALQTCKIILGHRVRIKAFYIPPEYLMSSQELVTKAYEYFENNANEYFEIVKL